MKQQEAKYVVYNEHTLGYLFYTGENRKRLGILRASVLRGSPYGDLSGPICVSPTDKIRNATVEDFNAYRTVVPPDFVQDEQTETAGEFVAKYGIVALSEKFGTPVNEKQAADILRILNDDLDPSVDVTDQTIKDAIWLYLSKWVS